MRFLKSVSRLFVGLSLCAFSLPTAFASEIVQVPVRQIDLDSILVEGIRPEQIESELYPSGMLLPTMYTDLLCFDSTTESIEITSDTYEFITKNYHTTDGAYTYAEYLAASSFVAITDMSVDYPELWGSSIFIGTSHLPEIKDVSKLQQVIHNFYPLLSGERWADVSDVSAIVNDEMYRELVDSGYSSGYNMLWDVAVDWTLTAETMELAIQFFNTRHEFGERCGVSFMEPAVHGSVVEPAIPDGQGAPGEQDPVDPVDPNGAEPAVPETPETPEVPESAEPAVPAYPEPAEPAAPELIMPEQSYDNPSNGDFYSDLDNHIKEPEFIEEEQSIDWVSLITTVALAFMIVVIIGLTIHRIITHNDDAGWKKWR